MSERAENWPDDAVERAAKRIATELGWLTGYRNWDAIARAVLDDAAPGGPHKDPAPNPAERVLMDTLMEIRDAARPGSPIHAAAASALAVHARSRSSSTMNHLTLESS